MGFFDDIDEEWKGKRILVKGNHPHAGETAIYKEFQNSYAGFGLIFTSEQGTGDFFVFSKHLSDIQIIKCQ